jgi:hypothetical protein
MVKTLELIEVKNMGATAYTSQTEYHIKATYGDVTSLFSFLDSGNNAEYESSIEPILGTEFSDNDLDEILAILDTYQSDIVEDQMFQYDTSTMDVSILDDSYYAFCPVILDHPEARSIAQEYSKKGYVLIIDMGVGHEKYSTRLLPYCGNTANNYGYDLLLYNSEHQLLGNGDFR